MPTIADAKNAHQPGYCWCGWQHTVSDSMIERARDLMRDDPTVTTEAVALQHLSRLCDANRMDPIRSAGHCH